MQEPPTVIARFVAHVVDLLRQRRADGAARHVWDAGAMLEPVGRVHRSDAEWQRLILMADRAARVWAPAIAGVLRDDHLDMIARQQPPVLSSRDAADAAQRVGSLRDIARERTGPRPGASVDEVRSALASLQALLRHVADGSPDRVQPTAVVAIPHAAAGLVAGLEIGAGFVEGIQGEVRATVAVLDALDDERGVSWGTGRAERTASESDVHRSLVRSLMGTLAMEVGAITHADDGGPLPQPPKIGRHRPDVAGRGAYGGLFIGEAKVGPELFEDHTQEQLADFLAYSPDGESVGVHLIVPKGWKAEARRAAAAAGRDIDRLAIYELGGLPGAPAPPPGNA